ncbi:PFU-domain-containing protein [Hymenopellis radicata]|nr:PFU-domain-containing protein [Hymenopellis radicata]
MSYKLSATLAAHGSDVRTRCRFANDDLVLSASRDATAISWQRLPSASSFTPELVLKAGSRYVNAVSYIRPRHRDPQDTVINVFSLDRPRDDPDYTLVGHSENVCALDTTLGGTIISGSWDRTAKVWKGFQLAHDLRGHEQSVWAVLAVDEDQYITGSADKSIKLWQTNKCVATFTGHRDAASLYPAYRGRQLTPTVTFSEIRVWTLGGDVVYTLSGHTSFVYSLSVLPNGDIVSAGEDRSVRVWKDGECSQVITHPAISVWTVSSMPNGDIVSGSSDGVVRIFTASEERYASQADLKEYDDLVASQALPTQQVGDVKKSDLPGLEALSTPGDAPGKVKMVRNGEMVEAHQWDAASFSWKKIGDVVDAVGQGRKQLYEGKEYDYVFDVDIQDGVPPLKLPYNVTENPYAAAQRFLERNELPLSYIDEVVKFIERNTSGVNLGSGADEYVDPFTGASRYRSSAASVPTGPSSSYVDPFTGNSRYTGTPSSFTQQSNDQYMDPFTGASRYSGAPNVSPTPAPPPPKSSILPATTVVSFKQANVTAMQGKILQFNEDIRNEISTSALAMYPQEITAFDEIFVYLSSVTPDSTGPSLLSVSHAEALIHILDRWPQSQLFPVVDLSRLVAGFCPEVLETPEMRTQFLNALFKASEWGGATVPGPNKTRDTNALLTLRALANLLSNGSAAGRLLIKAIEFASFNKTQRLALASLLFNVSCLAVRKTLSPEQQELHISLTLMFLSLSDNEAEAAYRALVGLGNTMFALKQQGARTGLASDVVF